MKEEKVVKCVNEQCGLHFGYSEETTKCPFCHTPHKAVEENIANTIEDKSNNVKSYKAPFKMWKKTI